MPQFLVPTSYKDAATGHGARAGADEAEGDARISLPFNFKHLAHARVDPLSSTGFAGLPEAWRALLKQSSIRKEDVLEYPQVGIHARTGPTLRSKPSCNWP